ncbi:MAG: hypothetical protein DLM73_16315 [Chthoniobacterales bacterium]|nr:MAG: hypothetical protein DLM73_16315 [Chthoniobacterales bacterium]
MKRLFGIFVLTVPEQRLVIFVVLLLVAGAWLKHQRDLHYSPRPQPTPGMSPSPQGAAVCKPPTN